MDFGEPVQTGRRRYPDAPHASASTGAMVPQGHRPLEFELQGILGRITGFSMLTYFNIRVLNRVFTNLCESIVQ